MGDQFILQRYLEELTNYADIIYQGSQADLGEQPSAASVVAQDIDRFTISSVSADAITTTTVPSSRDIRSKLESVTLNNTETDQAGPLPVEITSEEPSGPSATIALSADATAAQDNDPSTLEIAVDGNSVTPLSASTARDAELFDYRKAETMRFTAMRHEKRKLLDDVDTQILDLRLRLIGPDTPSSALDELLNQGADPNTVWRKTIPSTLIYDLDPSARQVFNNQWWSFFPIQGAAKHSNLACLQSLLRFGADPNCTTNYETRTALTLAVCNKDVDAAKLLLSYGADPNLPLAKSELSETATALYSAVQVEHIELVTLLLEAGADPNPFSWDLNAGVVASPLWWALRNETPLGITICTALLRGGANANEGANWSHLNQILNRVKTLPSVDIKRLHWAVDITEILLQNKADPNFIQDGKSPLCRAVGIWSNKWDPRKLTGEEEPLRFRIVDQLVCCGANVNVRNNSRSSPLLQAVLCQSLRLTSYLIGEGADPTTKCHGHRDPNVRSALEAAAWIYNVDILVLILQSPLLRDTDVWLKKGRLIHLAIARISYIGLDTALQSLEMIKFLLQKGANTGARTVTYNSASGLGLPNEKPGRLRTVKRLVSDIQVPEGFDRNQLCQAVGLI